MEISAIQKNTAYQQPQEAKPAQAQQNQPTDGAHESDSRKPDKISRDEYIPSKKASEKPPEKFCTMNTDQVDQEIEKLKEKQKMLRQQIKLAEGDDSKVKELERKLADVESQLSQKDNDAYRRQNASVSSSGPSGS